MENLLGTLIRRLKKIGIEIELVGNFPWIYLVKVNGNKVEDTYWSDHHYTIMFRPWKIGTIPHFINEADLFRVIRKNLCSPNISNDGLTPTRRETLRLDGIVQSSTL